MFRTLRGHHSNAIKSCPEPNTSNYTDDKRCIETLAKHSGSNTRGSPVSQSPSANTHR